MQIMNIATFVFGVFVLLVSVTIGVMHLKMFKRSKLSTVIIAYVVSDIFDVASTLIFCSVALNNQTNGDHFGVWNNIDPAVAIILRWIIFSSSLFAAGVAEYMARLQRKTFTQLSSKIEDVLNEGVNIHVANTGSSGRNRCCRIEYRRHSIAVQQ